MEVAFRFQGFYLIIRQKDQIYKSLKVSNCVSLLAIGSLPFSNFEHIQTYRKEGTALIVGSSLTPATNARAANHAKKHKT